MYTYLTQKRFFRWYFTLLSAIVISSCDHDEDFYYNDTTTPNISDNQHVITIFRNTFREYASLDIDYSLEGLHPGNFAPVWDEATLYTDTDRLTLTSPIITEATYDGSFICNSDTTITYHTAIAQQMILVYDFNNECFSFYIASIIPNEENATESRLKALKMFDIFTPESSFSGTVVYSNMTTNYTIAVEQYDSGHVTNVRTLFNFSGNIERDIEEMENIIGAKRICRNVRALTRDSEFTFTGMNYIDGVTCTAPKNSPSQTTYTAPTPTYTVPCSDFGPLPHTYPDYANRPHGGIGHSTKNNTSSSAHPSTMPSAPTKTSQGNTKESAGIPQEIINKISEYKFVDKMIKFIASKGIKITIKYNSKIGYSAMYNPNNKSITIKDAKSFSSYAFVHELFHAYQDAFYNGGIAQYSLGKPGFCNIEFECNLFMKQFDMGKPKGWGDVTTQMAIKMKASENLYSFTEVQYQQGLIEFKNYFREYNTKSISYIRFQAIEYIQKY